MAAAVKRHMFLRNSYKYCNFKQNLCKKGVTVQSKLHALYFQKRPYYQVFPNLDLTKTLAHCCAVTKRFYGSDTKVATEDYHTIISDKEKETGPRDKHEFQAETRMLLDIVAKSLYSEREVFIRELISNANDALERLRYQQIMGVIGAELGAPLEIHIEVDKDKKTLTIQDTGLGMTKQEMIDNLGTIARSGSKSFLQELQAKGEMASNIIGQFGVGFYAAFMVASNVDVFSLSHKASSKGHHWTSDGTGSFEIAEADGIERGTKIVIHLKPDCVEFADEDRVKNIIKKYSNFVGAPIYFNGKKVNQVEALWMMADPDITQDMHDEFYRFISGAYDRPRYSLHYKTDAPLNIRAVFYVPETKPSMFEMSREGGSGVSLYCKKVLIQDKAEQILPKWLRFMKGVVDSEDIPLNLSRELLQNSALISKLKLILTNRLTRYFQDQAKKDPAKFDIFYRDFGLFFREGIIMTADQGEKEDIAKLLRFESSKKTAGDKVSLMEYGERMSPGQRDIYYLAAPSRELAENSPYFESLKKRDVEVLFCYEPYDELVLMQLRQFDKKNLVSVEKEMTESKDESKGTGDDAEGLSQSDTDLLCKWLKGTLGSKVVNVKVTNKLSSHPCVVTVAEMGAARHFVRTAFQGIPEDQRYTILQPTLEVNPSHPLIKKLNQLRSTDSRLAKLTAEQIFDNSMVAAGLIEDPRVIVQRLNDLLTLALEKH